MQERRPLRIAFVHPDLGIGGAERLVVDAALGLQKLGHLVDIYTSHHDPSHCFEETRNGTLNVHAPKPPFPRSFRGKLHIVFANARQLHLITHLLRPGAPQYDVYFVDQLSTCVPFLRLFGHTRVLFYCHFPDKLLADGAYEEGRPAKNKVGLLKRIYRAPMDWVEEVTTGQADVILANSKFTARVFQAHLPSIRAIPRVVYPGINISAYEVAETLDTSDPDVLAVISDRPTYLSLNRFEAKKNAALAVKAFAQHKKNMGAKGDSSLNNMRLVLAGGYDPRLEDNLMTLTALIDIIKSFSLTYTLTKPQSSLVSLPPFNTGSPPNPDVLLLLNFSTPQRAALLGAKSTLALLYTPANEHFGIVPIEAMACGVPVLACASGGPTESVLDPAYIHPGGASFHQLVSPEDRTGWLREPVPEKWAEALEQIAALTQEERESLGERAKKRASGLFGMEAMAKGIEEGLHEAVRMGPVKELGWLLALLGLVLALTIAITVRAISMI